MTKSMSNLPGRLGLILSLIFINSAVQADVCKHGICVSSTSQGDRARVVYRSTASGVTHVNVISKYGMKSFTEDNPYQTEWPPSGSFYLQGSRTDRKLTYKIQVCARGGFLQKSGCLDWVNLFHSLD